MVYGVKGIRQELLRILNDSVGSQDSHSMTRDELKILACYSFALILVNASFCSYCSYPKTSLIVKTLMNYKTYEAIVDGIASELEMVFIAFMAQ